MLKKKQEDNSYLNIVKESSGNIVNVANNIIDILNVYQRSGYNNADMELNAVIKECVNCFNVIAIKKKNKIVFKEVNPIIINTDKDKLVQMIINLIDNSCKFTENGVVQISIKNKIVKISDTGIGISMEKQRIIDKIIDTRIEDFNFEESKGKVTGLGLLICKYICKELGIKISYKSQNGLGTVFYLDMTDLM
jgi:signal transduction histidine kinase